MVVVVREGGSLRRRAVRARVAAAVRMARARTIVISSEVGTPCPADSINLESSATWMYLRQSKVYFIESKSHRGGDGGDGRRAGAAARRAGAPGGRVVDELEDARVVLTLRVSCHMRKVAGSGAVRTYQPSGQDRH